MYRMLLNKAFIFTAGAVLGSVVTWKLLEAKYKKIADEEIASVKETYSNKLEWDHSDSEKIGDVESVEETDEGIKVKVALKDEYQKFTDNLSYTNYSNMSKSNETEDRSVDKPYVIPPEEFGEMDDYEKISLSYYADGVLADDMGELVDDVDDIVGLDSLTHFGEYEDDSVFVRNDVRKCDYEILLEPGNYSDLNKS